MCPHARARIQTQMHSHTLYKHMAARLICATGVIDQMRQMGSRYFTGIPPLESTKRSNLTSFVSLSLRHCKLEFDRLDIIKVKAQ